MSDDNKPVPKPGEAHRGDDEEIHYYEVDETNVSDAEPSETPATPRPDDDES